MSQRQMPPEESKLLNVLWVVCLIGVFRPSSVTDPEAMMDRAHWAQQLCICTLALT